MADSCMSYPPRFQWESSSGTFSRSQSNNCGPTGAAQQIDYYLGRDGTTGIERLRDSIGMAHGVPTSAFQQADMLKARGIAAEVMVIDSMDQLDKLVGTEGDRPVGIGILMSRLRPSTRGHTFEGWHRITLLKRGRRKIQGVYRRGYIYTDPNFRPPGSLYRTDPMKGHRWINRRELEYAFLGVDPSFAIVPLKRKP